MLRIQLCIVIILLATASVFSQNHGEELQNIRKTFFSHFNNFDKLSNKNSYSFFTLVKYTIGKRGKILKIDLSNNLDSTDYKIFLSELEKMDIKLLQNYFKINNLKNIDVIIPFARYVRDNDNITIDYSNFADFGKFNDVAFSGKTFWMEPIVMMVSIDY